MSGTYSVRLWCRFEIKVYRPLALSTVAPRVAPFKPERRVILSWYGGDRQSLRLAIYPYSMDVW